MGNMEENAEIRGLMGSSASSSWSSKDKLVAKLRNTYGYTCDQVVLVEDDPEEVLKATNVCRTVLVKQANGMTSEHFDALHGFHTGRSCSKEDDNSSVPAAARSRCSIM